MLSKQGIPVAAMIDDWRSLVTLLLRIRRESRLSDRTRCLSILQWMFEKANFTPPADYRSCWDNAGTCSPGYEPNSPPPIDAIALPK